MESQTNQVSMSRGAFQFMVKKEELEEKKQRLVRCPKCRNILCEPSDLPLYLCGGCGTALQAKNLTAATEEVSSLNPNDESKKNTENKEIPLYKKKKKIDSGEDRRMLSDANTRYESGDGVGTIDAERQPRESQYLFSEEGRSMASIEEVSPSNPTDESMQMTENEEIPLDEKKICSDEDRRMVSDTRSVSEYGVELVDADRKPRESECLLSEEGSNMASISEMGSNGTFFYIDAAPTVGQIGELVYDNNGVEKYCKEILTEIENLKKQVKQASKVDDEAEDQSSLPGLVLLSDPSEPNSPYNVIDNPLFCALETLNRVYHQTKNHSSTCSYACDVLVSQPTSNSSTEMATKEERLSPPSSPTEMQETVKSSSIDEITSNRKDLQVFPDVGEEDTVIQNRTTKIVKIDDKFLESSGKNDRLDLKIEFKKTEETSLDLSLDYWQRRGGSGRVLRKCSSSVSDFAMRIISKVHINDHHISFWSVKKAEKQAGRIEPGNYWYDYLAGFWGAMGHPCLGIIPPLIEVFNYPMRRDCSGGNTGVVVNGRELHVSDLRLLFLRGLPNTPGMSYIMESSGKVWDESSGEELFSIGNLAPNVERTLQGFGMRIPGKQKQTRSSPTHHHLSSSKRRTSHVSAASSRSRNAMVAPRRRSFVV